MPQTTKIFDEVYHLKSRGVTYWAERNGQPNAQIIDKLERQFLARFCNQLIIWTTSGLFLFDPLTLDYSI
jgi:hypothetical protein